VLLGFGFLGFGVKPGFLKKTQLDRFLRFYEFSVFRLSTAGKILLHEPEYKILPFGVDFLGMGF